MRKEEREKRKPRPEREKTQKTQKKGRKTNCVGYRASERKDTTTKKNFPRKDLEENAAMRTRQSLFACLATNYQPSSCSFSFPIRCCVFVPEETRMVVASFLSFSQVGSLFFQRSLPLNQTRFPYMQQKNRRKRKEREKRFAGVRNREIKQETRCQA